MALLGIGIGSVLVPAKHNGCVYPMSTCQLGRGRILAILVLFVQVHEGVRLGHQILDIRVT